MQRQMMKKKVKKAPTCRVLFPAMAFFRVLLVFRSGIWWVKLVWSDSGDDGKKITAGSNRLPKVLLQKVLDSS